MKWYNKFCNLTDRKYHLTHTCPFFLEICFSPQQKIQNKITFKKKTFLNIFIVKTIFISAFSVTKKKKIILLLLIILEKKIMKC